MFATRFFCPCKETFLCRKVHSALGQNLYCSLCFDHNINLLLWCSTSILSKSPDYLGSILALCTLLTLWSRQTKSLPIFTKLLQLVLRGMLSSELFEFLRYLYSFQRYAKCSFSGFVNSARLFEYIFSQKLQCLNYFLF